MFVLSALLFHYIHVPVANMRETPQESSQIVSQGVFSEQVHLLEERGDWTLIETESDHYQGWVKSNQVCHRQEPFVQSTSCIAKVNRCMAHLYQMPDTTYGPMMTLPFESLLKVMDVGTDTQSRWIKVVTVDGQEAFIQRGDVAFTSPMLTCEEMVVCSQRFLGLPYTWGGRSSFGYDCSGFVQMLYRQMGLFIPRDVRDQVEWEGFSSVEIQDLSPGDLVFFGLSQDKIRHVGMYIGSELFIHATVAENAPYIHISKSSDLDWNGSGKWVYRVARTLKK